VAGATPVVLNDTDTKPSYARGGLSTVWGGAVLPYRQSDIADWPISLKDLEPGYRAVLEWMPLAGRKDAIADFFPLHTDAYRSLPVSAQAAAMLAGLEDSRAQLNARGFYFGSSRLGVTAAGCVQCGLCMYGCPHNLIYSSAHTLTSLLKTGRVDYQPGVTVRSLQETNTSVRVQAVDAAGGPVEFDASRVFLGAGTLNTTAILLRSLQQYDVPVTIRDSQYFLLPLLRLRGTADVASEPLHTLAQLFVEIFDGAISPYTIHLQTYTYNEQFCESVLGTLGPFKKMFPLEAFLGRLLLFQGYLHSAHSAAISATLRREESGDALHLKSIPNPETGGCLSGLSRKLVKLSRYTGVVPVNAMLKVGKPGRGFHSGGSFPMSANPGQQETDTLGRPHGFRRVHAIDSTVLPTIPATTITFTVMANAYRIGCLSAAQADGKGA
jgi:choline dehydrogenase-like flavoprotein